VAIVSADARRAGPDAGAIESAAPMGNECVFAFDIKISGTLLHEQMSSERQFESDN
jgi:hypothetical protein